MTEDDWVKDTITLRGEEIPVRVGYLTQAELKFYPENPRVYTILSAGTKEPTQQEIEIQLLARDNVKQLVQSIKANGGLTDPVFVLDGSNIVIEGNSRLAAYRALARSNPIQWGKIKCKVLPKEIDEDKIFSLLGEYHIIGKQDWIPYEQAGYLYRRCIFHKVKPELIAKDLGLTESKVNHLIGVYTFMVANEDNAPDRWSYYDEYMKSSKIKKIRKKYPEFDEIVVQKIKSQEIPKAIDVREGLKKIANSNDKIVKSFINGKADFQESMEHAISGGSDTNCYQKIQKFRLWFVDPKTRKEVSNMSEQVTKKCIYELKKIKQGLEFLLNRLDA